ncbi:hypothetical protein [Aequorivita marina]|uniref:hypothetical protein n=1 Tax=Aequorivita marina TaxID=3073654 RepID=UPI0028757878|nr:hypothetical protein [Aequorivita sp. S2608]MDS1299157.1 hypothetical protein [Aequorivita sp. S2608]
MLGCQHFNTSNIQHQIVQKIEIGLSVCDTIEKDLTASLEKVQALRQSILKKAFEGKLLSEEEIAECKLDKEYEPASVLLEKIKAEKRRRKNEKWKLYRSYRALNKTHLWCY